MKSKNLTLIGLAISVVIWLATIITGVDIFEMFVATLASLEAFEIDEFIIPVVIFGIFALSDLITKQRNRKIEDEREREKVKIYKAMLSSTHHILNNFLNQMQLFKMTAEKTQGFPNRVLGLYDQIINDAVIQIEALGSISNIDELSISASVSPQSSTQQIAAADAEKPNN